MGVGVDRHVLHLARAFCIATLLVGCSLAGSSPTATSGVTDTDAVRYVALGDSYTIGTSVGETDRWPNQLVGRLAARGTRLDLVANLGVNGFTSRDVIDVELPRVAELKPGLVSILVGVNDVVQGVDPETYRTNVAILLSALQASAPAPRILAVSTPDYTVTPQGANYGDPAKQSAAIRTANAILEELAASRGIAFVDIYDLSLGAEKDRSLVARDGLHPSGAQYALWVDRIAPVVEELLKP
jgi:lysophospholipase L1-like esterase